MISLGSSSARKKIRNNRTAKITSNKVAKDAGVATGIARNEVEGMWAVGTMKKDRESIANRARDIGAEKLFLGRRVQWLVWLYSKGEYLLHRICCYCLYEF